MRRPRQAAKPQQRPLRDALVWHPATEPPKLTGWYWIERIRGAEKTLAWFHVEGREWIDMLYRPMDVSAWASDLAEEDGEPFAYGKFTPRTVTYSSVAQELGVKECTLRYWVLKNGCPLSVQGARNWISTSKSSRTKDSRTVSDE